MKERPVHNLEELMPEKQAERGSLNTMQTVYVVYGLLYGLYCRMSNREGTYSVPFDLKLFIGLSVILVIFTAVVLIMNRRSEEGKHGKWLCNLVALFAVGIGVCRFWWYML